MKRADFDGMLWPIPDEDLEWRLRYGNPTKADLMNASAYLASYSHLIQRTQKRRNYICKKIKEQM